MIMDDHEITNDFSNDMDSPSQDSTPRQFRDIGMKAYREFVHIRQPNDFGRQALYYRFEYGTAQFFMLDTRTERYLGRGSHQSQIISDLQMETFLSWLKTNKNRLKFVVSSVPFVGEVKNDDDKWAAVMFRHQREQIIRFIHDENINSLVFLTGDMHNSYHGKLEIKSEQRQIVIHELMSSPINQLQKTGSERYLWGQTKTTKNNIRYTSRLVPRKYYCEHSNAMLIKVNDRRIRYEVFRTKKTKRREITGTFTA